MADGAVVAELPREQENRAKAEWPYHVGLVYLRDLIVDDTYQRPAHESFIARTVEQFDPTLVGCIDVHSRNGGVYAILDGQQRFRVMQQVGKTACFCAIYTGLTIQDEAGFFYRKNRDRMAMKGYYGFRARVVAGDLEATAIRDTVENAGFVLGPTSNEREVIGAIRAVEYAWGYASEYRDESLTPALNTIRAAFFGRKDSLNAWLIQGLGRFWQSYTDEEVDEELLATVLQAIGPSTLIALGKEKQAVTAGGGAPHGRSLPWVIARVLVEEYNRKKRGSARGPQFRGRLNPERVLR